MYPVVLTGWTIWKRVIFHPMEYSMDLYQFLSLREIFCGIFGWICFQCVSIQSKQAKKGEKNGWETPFSQEKSWGEKKEKAGKGALRGRTLVILSADKPKEAKSRNFSVQSWKICENYEGL